ncbi:GH92 family glycosyl hydrolase [Vallitalea okinawensis]|uniref:GH92 family glycosyl hydrolase n=1 Tax=Vallitalea okinawensis TaxID=2078660 RepID=UPI0013003F97|nr:GH92 family glycosyl hydrolase [Vallitalea okinawensis]
MKLSIDYINPIIGCTTVLEDGDRDSVGKTFPGSTTPFGLVQLSPDTTDKSDHTSGYNYYDNEILGFSLARMTGVGWYGEFGNFRIMPIEGTPGFLPTEVASVFDHKTEDASIGYYRVLLDRYHVMTELTTARRAGMMRFSFNGSKKPGVVIDLSRRIGGHSAKQLIKITGKNTLEGWMDCPSSSGGWGKGAGKVSYKMHFYAEFSEPFDNYKFIDGKKTLPNQTLIEGEQLFFQADFTCRTLLVKVGISFVDIQGAKKNLESDIPHWDFERVYMDNRKLWDEALGGIKISGGTEVQKEAFFTSLYHTMIDPRMASDSDGRYVGADGKIHTTSNFVYRTVFSGWDVFRSQFPLQTILNPQLVNDEINSFIQLAQLSGKGYLPKWEIMNSYSGCMVGDPAISVITDAYLKGIRDYDVEAAYLACRQTALGKETNRDGAADYLRLGWVPNELSCTLENCYADWCLAQLAKALGKEEDYKILIKMAENYRKIYDPSVGCMRAKDHEGNFIPWEGKTSYGQGCVESNPFQQEWFVPHDVEGLKQLMGEEHFYDELIELFEKTPKHMKWNDYYNHSNEPVHTIPFMFAAAGRPWLTQQWTRFIVDHAYGTGPEGIIGNEDVGQMSAWYVFAAMGFHPLCPGDSHYILNGPLFKEITIQLDDQYHSGKEFKIIADNYHPDNCYIKSVRLNGEVLEQPWITHKDIISGGELRFEMSHQPNKSWGKNTDVSYPSLTMK